jgi:NitT/TauT family transport system permease protein/sulfonate transport system permease protein
MFNFFKKFLFIFLLLIFWQFLYIIFDIKNYVLPAPLEVAAAFGEIFVSGEIFSDILNSLLKVAGGFFIAAFFGILFGILFSYFRTIGNYIKPIIEILRPIPPIAWIPIAILIFGLGNASAIFIIFLGAFFPVFINTYFGASSIPAIYKNISKTFELKPFVYLKKVLFFYSLPNIFTGLKIGLGMAWICVIAAEMISAQSGLGYFIQINRLLLRTDKVIAGMIIIGLMGFFLNSLVNLIEKKIIKWR